MVYMSAYVWCSEKGARGYWPAWSKSDSVLPEFEQFPDSKCNLLVASPLGILPTPHVAVARLEEGLGGRPPPLRRRRPHRLQADIDDFQGVSAGVFCSRLRGADERCFSIVYG